MEQDVIRFLSRFVQATTDSGAAWSIVGKGDLAEFYDATGGLFPLWPDKQSAKFFIERHWPDFRTARLTHRRLSLQLPILAAVGIPVGLGIAPSPRALVLPAMVLYEALHDDRDPHAA